MTRELEMEGPMPSPRLDILYQMDPRDTSMPTPEMPRGGGPWNRREGMDEVTFTEYKPPREDHWMDALDSPDRDDFFSEAMPHEPASPMESGLIRSEESSTDDHQLLEIASLSLSEDGEDSDMGGLEKVLQERVSQMEHLR